MEKSNIKKPVYKKWWFWLIIIIAIGGIIGAAAGTQNKETAGSSFSEEQSSSSSPEAQQVQAVEFIEAYENNGVAADNDYKGKLLKISGTVKSIDVDVANRPYVLLADVRNEYAIIGVQCYFSEENKESLTSLNEGDSVVITGTCEGKVVNVSIKDCKLEK